MGNMKNRRIELNLQQQDVADYLRQYDSRMDASMVSRFENCVCLPTPDVMGHLEEVLQADRSDLFDYIVLGDTVDVERYQLTPSPTTEVVLAAIPHGRANAISRENLAIALGMTDRMMRKAIEIARDEGAMIICNSDGHGYYQSDELDEIAKQYRQDTSRAMSILKRRKTMRKVLKDAGRRV